MVCVLSLENTVGQYLDSPVLGFEHPIKTQPHDQEAAKSKTATEVNPPVAPPSTVESVAPIAPGTEVHIKNLVKLPDFNGLPGVVHGCDIDSGRYDVLLDSPAGVKGWRWVKVLIDNLELRSPKPPASKTRRGTRRGGRKPAPTIDADAAEAVNVSEPGARARANSGSQPPVAAAATPTTPGAGILPSPAASLPATPKWAEDFCIVPLKLNSLV